MKEVPEYSAYRWYLFFKIDLKNSYGGVSRWVRDAKAKGFNPMG